MIEAVTVSLIYISLFPQDIEHLGLASIASYLRKNGIMVELVRVSIDDSIEVITKKINLKSDYFGFSLYSTNAKKAFEISALLKEYSPACKVMFGGEFAETTRKFIFEDCAAVDFIVLGNGEIPVLNLLQCLENKKDISSLPYIATRNNYIDKKGYEIDLKSRDWVVRDYLEECKKNLHYTANIDTSKGCYGRCSFCANAILKYEHIWQGRDMDDVFAEIKHINGEYGIRSFMLTDSSFEDPVGYGKERVRHFLELILADDVKYHFWCYLRADIFKQEDKDLVTMMRQAGFTNVFIGIETFNENDLRIYNKRATLDMNEMIIKLFNECGINVDIGFIMFNPYSSLEGIQENYHFLRKHRPYYLSNYTSQIIIHYGTHLHKRLLQEDLLKEDYTYLNEMAYRFLDPAIEEIVQFIKGNIEKSPIAKWEQSLASFDRFYYNIKAQFPDEITLYEKEYSYIKDEMSTELVNFFQILYEKVDINGARDAFAGFQTNMLNWYRQFNKYSVKVYRKFTYLLAN